MNYSHCASVLTIKYLWVEKKINITSKSEYLFVEAKYYITEVNTQI